MLPVCVEFSGYLSRLAGTEYQLLDSLTLKADMLVQGKLLLICRENDIGLDRDGLKRV